ncbi:hypothetical protein [Actinoallomurus iriomotensis]|uniref:Uncharacterized protein n=1 Tax=Actinoallomurus iriomotensis TaxID=478107 RepID=A0A9W6W3G1_9ACTN|nr:hypothetical protein [Actinoallomurus iriomotensis]GLY88867.1 hypothetical protein Airi02_067960 [Actinoallomurus iriomotensis]
MATGVAAAHGPAAARVECRDESEVQELFLRNGWGDGLPVLPPTPERVGRFVEAIALPPGHVLGSIPEQGRDVTAEHLAVNAVAAGCRVEYASVLVASVRALLRPEFGLHSATISGATAPLQIISGDAVRQLSLNSGFSLFGPGHQANATIGRAVRLLLQNVCGGVPAVLDKSTFGHPGKYGYCIAEDPERTPWDPLHTARGLRAHRSGVTVFSGEAPVNARNDWSAEPGPILATIADAMRPSHFTGGTFVVVLGPLHAAALASAGLTREDVQRELHERSARSTAELERAGRWPAGGGSESEYRHAAESPDHVVVTVAGGHLYGYSAVIPPWVAGPDSLPVTEPVPV